MCQWAFLHGLKKTSAWKCSNQVIQLTIITNYDPEKKEAHKMSTLINIYWSNEFSLCDNKLNHLSLKTHQLIQTKLNKL